MSVTDALNISAEDAMRDARKASERRRLFLTAAERTYRKVLAFGEARQIKIWEHAILKALQENDIMWLFALATAKRIPVPFEEFAHSAEFFGDQMEVWPALMPKLKEANADVLAGEPPVHETYMGGATGTGKTARAHLSLAYQLYCFDCFDKPQQIYGLNAATPIVFLLQSVSMTITNRVIYKPFRQMFTSMPYAQKFMTWNKLKESELEFTNNLQVIPSLASINSMVGSAIPAGLFDEINFMAVINDSKQVPGISGQGGLYDQAHIIHSNVTRRRKRSFAGQGPSFGNLNFTSSTRYQGDFLDRRMAEAIENNEKHVLVCREKQYEVNPKHINVPERDRFRFLVGTDIYAGRILKDFERAGEHFPEDGVVELIPNFYYQDFQRNPEEASRDVIGVASLAITPFISQRHKVLEAIIRGRDAGIKNWVEKADVDLIEDGMPQWNHEVLTALPADVKRRDWYVHVDLSRNKDRCGIACSSVSDYSDIVVGDGDARFVERLPVYDVGFSVSIKPHPSKEISIPEIRQFITHLKVYYGINIAAVTYDGFDSRESILMWNKIGIRSQIISVDTKEEPYEFLRDALYTDRVNMTDHELLRLELVQLEHLKEKKKIDHPAKGSKDVSDGLAGSIYAAGKARTERAKTGAMKVGGERFERKPEERPTMVRPDGRARPTRQGGPVDRRTEDEKEYG